MKLVALERHLRGCGCAFLREGGSHTIWRNSANGKIASVPRHREMKRANGPPHLQAIGNFRAVMVPFVPDFSSACVRTLILQIKTMPGAEL